MSPNEGLINGQDIEISGAGFAEEIEKNTVDIDGVNCEVINVTSTSITCKVGARDPNDTQILDTNADSQTNGYLGGSGFEYTRYDISSVGHFSFSHLRDHLNSGHSLPIKEKSVRAVLETYDVYGGYYGEVFKGYFYAPVSG